MYFLLWVCMLLLVGCRWRFACGGIDSVAYAVFVCRL